MEDEPRPSDSSVSTPLISAIILNYNKAAYTRLCIEGICRTRYRPLEIILVDNGSTEPFAQLKTAAEQLTCSAGVRLVTIRNDSNIGAPAGRNAGMRAAGGHLFLFIDNDAVPFNATWLDDMVDGIRRLPHAAIVSARLLYPFPPHRLQFAGCGISRTGRVQYIGRGSDHDDAPFQTDREAQCLISACILARADIVRQVGGFDEAYSPVQYEDLDLCYRVREIGFRCYVVASAEVYHFENTTTDGSIDINFRYVTIKNGLRFKQRWRHRYEQENGPSDAETEWLKLEQRTLDQMGMGWDPWRT